MRIGLLSDTHLPGERRELWDEVRSAFEGVAGQRKVRIFGGGIGRWIQRG